MPDQAGLVIVHSFDYRGDKEEWSNRYHFSGSPPADQAGWETLANAVVAAEQPTQDSNTTWVRAYGYAAGNDNAVAVVDFEDPGPAPAGTLAPNANDFKMAGDAAAWIRWKTSGLSSTGKVIYLRKYMHGVYSQGSSFPDKLASGQAAALETFATAISDGSISGFTIVGPQGAAAGSIKVSTFITTRTLKRRGGRPLAP